MNKPMSSLRPLPLAAGLLSFAAAIGASLPAAAAPGPDLTVTAVDASGMVTDPQTLEVAGLVTATVKNAGDTTTGAGFSVVFFADLDKNGAFDPATDSVLGVTSTGPLLDGAEATVSAFVSGAPSRRATRPTTPHTPDRPASSSPASAAARACPSPPSSSGRGRAAPSCRAPSTS